MVSGARGLAQPTRLVAAEDPKQGQRAARQLPF